MKLEYDVPDPHYLLVSPFNKVAELWWSGEHQLGQLPDCSGLLLGRVVFVPLAQARLPLATDQEHEVDHPSNPCVTLI